MRKFYRRGISLALALVMMAALLAGCGNKDGIGGDSLGLDVDPADVALPLAETATIKGLASLRDAEQVAAVRGKSAKEILG